jgi:hypothetical protein
MTLAKFGHFSPSMMEITQQMFSKAEPHEHASFKDSAKLFDQ